MNTNDYSINEISLPVGGVAAVRAEPLEGGGTGRDESGYLHRQVLRQRLRRWEFSYRDLSAAALRALLAQLNFQESCILDGPEGRVLCCLSQLTHRRRDSLTGHQYEVSFVLEEC